MAPPHGEPDPPDRGGVRPGRTKDAPVSESASATSGRPERAASAGGTRPKKERNLFGRIALFVRQVIAELKKVVRPTRSELLTYFVVVLVFVAAIMAFVGLLDLSFGRLVLWIFG
jgi:preprotein translocase subunit SecE